jgi:hypothetical protein
VKRAVLAALVASALVTSSAARADDVVIAPASAEVAPEPSHAHPTYFGLVSGGASYRRLYGIPIEAADLGLGVGSESKGIGLYVHAGFEPGRTIYGLTTRVYRLGASVEGIVGRFRMGGGLDVLDFTVTRITDPTTTMTQLGIGVFALASLDVVRFDGHALFLGLRGDLDSTGSATLGASVALGFRL